GCQALPRGTPLQVQKFRIGFLSEIFFLVEVGIIDWSLDMLGAPRMASRVALRCVAGRGGVAMWCSRP
ncbi:hypothetical protein HAX54_008908, partial [Datura stramonium]|nr:hypothetical protein [Datura stramonium]